MSEPAIDPTTVDPATLSYEQARDALAHIVARLEDGSAPLEESLALWERGEALAQRCTEFLDRAQARLDEATSPGTSGSADASGPDAAAR